MLSGQFTEFIFNLEVEDLTKVNSEIHVESSTVCSGYFFIIVQDLDEEGLFGQILSTTKFGTKKDQNYSYNSGENVNVYQFVVSRAQVSKGPPICHQRTSSN